MKNMTSIIAAKWLFVFPVVLVFLVYSFSARADVLSGIKIGLDPGHGGSDPGALGWDGGGYPDEKDFNLEVALALRAQLLSDNADVVMTRDWDCYMSLTDRVDYIDSEMPDAFISIHCNSFGDPIAHGTETYLHTYGTVDDEILAECVQYRLIESLQRFDRGVKQASFTVLTVDISIPVVLTELLFISNEEEFYLMDSFDGQQKAVDGLRFAIFDFFGIPVPDDVDFWWGPIAFEDDFDDNYFNPAMWVQASGGSLPGYVVEQNQQLEFHGRKYARPANDFSAHYKITGWALAGGSGGGQGPETSIKLRSDGGLLGWLGTPTGIKVSYWPEWDARGAMHIQTNYDGELSTSVLLWPAGQTSPHNFKFEVVDTGEFVSLYIEDSVDADNNCTLTLHGLDNPLYDYGDYIYLGSADGDIFYDDIVVQMPRTLSDFDENEIVDFSDFAVMASAWLSEPGESEWDSIYDISDPSDDIIDLLDVSVFAEQWLWQAPPEP